MLCRHSFTWRVTSKLIDGSAGIVRPMVDIAFHCIDLYAPRSYALFIRYIARCVYGEREQTRA